jgi:hypothetical protein
MQDIRILLSREQPSENIYAGVKQGDVPKYFYTPKELLPIYDDNVLRERKHTKYYYSYVIKK